MEHPQHTLALLDPAVACDIMSIDCAPATVTIHLRSADAARALLAGHTAGDFVSGACPSVVDADSGEEESAPFYRRVVASSLTMGADGSPDATLVLVTEDVKLPELFDSLNITFKWSPPSRDPVTPYKERPNTASREAERAAAAAAAAAVRQARSRDRRFLGQIGNFLNDLGEKVVDTVTSTVDKVVETFNKISDEIKSVLLGKKGSFKQSFNLVNLNCKRLRVAFGLNGRFAPISRSCLPNRSPNVIMLR